MERVWYRVSHSVKNWSAVSARGPVVHGYGGGDGHVGDIYIHICLCFGSLALLSVSENHLEFYNWPRVLVFWPII